MAAAWAVCGVWPGARSDTGSGSSGPPPTSGGEGTGPSPAGFEIRALHDRPCATVSRCLACRPPAHPGWPGSHLALPTHRAQKHRPPVCQDTVEAAVPCRQGGLG